MQEYLIKVLLFLIHFFKVAKPVMDKLIEYHAPALPDKEKLILLGVFPHPSIAGAYTASYGKKHETLGMHPLDPSHPECFHRVHTFNPEIEMTQEELESFASSIAPAYLSYN
jgi:hypothetical protein